MTEDIRSMLTSRAKVPPRNSALKFSKPKKDDEDAVFEVSSDTLAVREDAVSVDESLELPAVAEELLSQDKRNKQRSKTTKNDIQPPTSNSVSADNNSAKSTVRHGLSNAEETLASIPQESISVKTEVENTLLPSENSTIASSQDAIRESESTSSESPSDLQKIQAELEKLPQIGKRLAVHLEQQIRAELLYLCDRQEITPEIFLEAAFVALQNQPELLKEIVTDAKERLATRKRAGFLRRTKSMIGKIG
jgi:hypothetical protein